MTAAIAVSKLEIDPQNVRKSYDAKGLADLAANIEANGLLQNLVVRPAEKKGHFYVTAGGRRLRALKLLIEEKRLPKTHQVMCNVREGNEALEISLSENVMREEMHPLDQFEAFSALAQEGKAIDAIAVRYGTTEIIVKRRLALAKVHPALREVYREGKMSFDQLSAFTVTEDQSEQMRVWESLPSYNRHAGNIKAALAGEGVRATDKRVKFVGLDAYAQAGGNIMRDLFDEKGGFVTDIALLEKLTAEKLAAEVAKVKAEGWAWVEIMPEWDWNYSQAFARVYPKPVALTEDEQAQLDALTVEHERLEQLIESGDDDGGAEAELQEIEAKIKGLDRDAYDAYDIAKSGVLLTITHAGDLRIERGFFKDESKSKSKTSHHAEAEGDETPSLVHTAALTEDLTAQKTAALRIELAKNHDVALAAVVHAMLLNVAYEGYQRTEYSSLEMRVTHSTLEGSMKRPDQSKALAELEAITEDMQISIPKNPADLWDWCIDLKPAQLMALLAFAASRSINAVVGKSSFRTKKQLAHADQLGMALGTDMRDYFQPTAESYFEHMNRSSIQAAVAEVKGEDFAKGIAAMKKKDAAAYAESALKGSDWLPAPLLFVQPVSEIDVDASPDDADDEETDIEEHGEERASAEIIQFPEAAA